MPDQPLTDICFENFPLHPDLLKGLEEGGLIRCTPIQAMTLPLTLGGKDVAGQAQTGTGKTAAFLVALYNRLLNGDANPRRRAQDPRAVILAPTRELAVQIDKDAQLIGQYTGLRTALIYGGVDYDKQRKLLMDGIDIIIATPGRLIDFLKQDVVSFRAIEVMIMDEADRMFELGFIKDIRFLLRRMPDASERQNLLFSATLSHRVLELAYEHMNDPEKIVVATDTVTVASVRQTVYFPSTEEKLPLLLGILARADDSRSMIFVNTKYACERIALTLERAGYRVGVLSGDVPQRKRESLLARFVSGDLALLVATDVAARGLHIPAVSHVYNFDLPFDAEDYVHRIGRTARLGAEGDAISFACDEYAMSLPDIESFIAQKIPVATIDPAMLLPVPRARAPRRDGEAAGATVVEDALSGAAAEREKRRERERRDGGGRRDGRTGARSGPRPGGRGRVGEPRSQSSTPRVSETRAEPPPPPSLEPDAGAAPPAGVERERKRRRRSRGKGRGKDAAGASMAAAPMPVAVSAVAEAPPKLRAKLKQTIKSWVRRLGMPRGRP